MVQGEGVGYGPCSGTDSGWDGIWGSEGGWCICVDCEGAQSTGLGAVSPATGLAWVLPCWAQKGRTWLSCSQPTFGPGHRLLLGLQTGGDLGSLRLCVDASWLCDLAAHGALPQCPPEGSQ